MRVSFQQIISVSLVVVATIILFASLLTANKQSLGDTSRVLGRRIYVGRTILPDNVLYPFVMVMDRLRLETAADDQKIFLKLEYAQRRFEYAVALADRHNQSLALTTLTKSQKYLFSAATQILEDPAATTVETKQLMAKALDHSLYRLELFSGKFGADPSGIITDLEQQTTVLLHEINSIIDAH
ncbi:hypothetical protein KA082_03425 [Candidatus Woesebacteria bacterium]|nr:hypothetical protein [Candidatus Woesebacteria bacterium]